MQSRLRLTLELTPYIMRGFVTNLNMGSIRGIFKGSVRFRKLAIVVSGTAKNVCNFLQFQFSNMYKVYPGMYLSFCYKHKAFAIT